MIKTALLALAIMATPAWAKGENASAPQAVALQCESEYDGFLEGRFSIDFARSSVCLHDLSDCATVRIETQKTMAEVIWGGEASDGFQVSIFLSRSTGNGRLIEVIGTNDIHFRTASVECSRPF